MLHLLERMPLVFIIAQDWILRTAVRAELRERGVDALGMDTPDDLGRMIASGHIPALIVLEGVAELVSDAGVQTLISNVPTVLIASRTERILLSLRNEGQAPCRGAVLYRPVRISDVVSRVMNMLRKGQAA